MHVLCSIGVLFRRPVSVDKEWLELLNLSKVDHNGCGNKVM